MRIVAVTLFTFLCWAKLACGDPTLTVPAPEAGKHIGEVVTVEGQVVSIHRSAKGNIFLNFGAAYPNQVLTGWIPPESNAQNSPYLDGIEGKNVQVHGRVELYRGKPEIRIDSEEQLYVSNR
jgi:DNA/RNA endonuclease YhcR with UshA esterase domain